jgi:hypothetical protein
MPSEVVNPARGTTLSHATAVAPTVFTAIAQVVSIDSIPRGVGTRETKHLGSSADTFAPTIIKNGALSGKLLYDPKGTSHLILEGLMITPALDKWKVVFNDATNGPTTYISDGILTNFSPTGIEVEANLEADFEIQLSGAVAVT